MDLGEEKFSTGVPKEISSHVIELCKQIDPSSQPTYLSVQSNSGKINECFANVDRHIYTHGGSKQHGWLIWEWPGVYVEGEFHCVWSDPDGKLIDITPRFDNATEVLFLPDSKLVYQGVSRPNRRLAVTDDSLVREYLEACKKFDKIRRYNKDFSQLSQAEYAQMMRLRKLDKAIHDKYDANRI